MKRITAALLAASLTVAACGIPNDTIALPSDPEAVVLQVRSEGGFAPVEFILGQGPRYTLMGDGTLISEGPVIAIYPGPLLPNYQMTMLDDGQLRLILDLVADMGLADMDDELDDTHTRTVADATTEVITYWDELGTHSYSVYALGLVDDTTSVRPATKAFQDLLSLLGEMASTGDSAPYRGERVQIVAGAGFADPDFPDVRDWPLRETDFGRWHALPNGWLCRSLGSEALDLFTDASRSTQWLNPDPSLDASALTLLVRPLHPGEEPCFGN